MKISINFKNPQKDKGATIVLVAVLLVVILGFAALAIDVGNLAATKGELQKIADGAALAGAGELGDQYLTEDCGTISFTDISTIASDVATQNVADAVSISLNADDIVTGCWDFDEQEFTTFGEADCSCSQIKPNAVRVTARRDSEANTPIDTFFAGVLGPDTVGLSADAVAALSGPSVAEGLPIPVGISKAWFKEDSCDQPIKFYPTGTLDGCAGWHVYDQQPSSVPKLEEWLECLALPEDDLGHCSPGGSVGDVFDYTGGTLASVFPEMKALYDAKKDPVTGEWKVTVPVYNWDNCSNPNDDIGTAGFATAVITEVLEAPEKTIQAKVVCDVIPSRGGGGSFGTLGSIPNLVE